MFPFTRRPKLPKIHSIVIHRGRLCEVTRYVKETGTLWCDVDDVDTGDRHSVPVSVLINERKCS